MGSMAVFQQCGINVIFNYVEETFRRWLRHIERPGRTLRGPTRNSPSTVALGTGPPRPLPARRVFARPAQGYLDAGLRRLPCGAWVAVDFHVSPRSGRDSLAAAPCPRTGDLGWPHRYPATRIRGAGMSSTPWPPLGGVVHSPHTFPILNSVPPRWHLLALCGHLRWSVSLRLGEASGDRAGKTLGGAET